MAARDGDGHSRRHANVVNIDELEAIAPRVKGRFGITARRLGRPAGAKAIGINWVELQPGKKESVDYFEGEDTGE